MRKKHVPQWNFKYTAMFKKKKGFSTAMEAQSYIGPLLKRQNLLVGSFIADLFMRVVNNKNEYRMFPAFFFKLINNEANVSKGGEKISGGLRRRWWSE